MSLPFCAWGAGRSRDRLVLKTTRPGTPEGPPGRSGNAEGAEGAPAGRGKRRRTERELRHSGYRKPPPASEEGELRPAGAEACATTPRPWSEQRRRGGSHGKGRGEHLLAKPARCRAWRLPGHPRPRGARGTPPRPPERGRPRRLPSHSAPGLPAPLGAAARPRLSSPCGSAACRGLRARTARSACGPSAAAAAAPRRSRTPPWRPQAPARLSVCLSVRPPPRCRPPPLPRAAEPRARPRPGAFLQPAAARGRHTGGSALRPRAAPPPRPATPLPPRPPIADEQCPARANERPRMGAWCARPTAWRSGGRGSQWRSDKTAAGERRPAPASGRDPRPGWRLGTEGPGTARPRVLVQ